ncbi:MAG TPA: RNA-binding S4 domain-containing protein [Steroidobacteraceae bacterium]|nr:RNA-binding S4 domain-containing protein [Steroidobacteraceae bacterium]
MQHDGMHGGGPAMPGGGPADSMRVDLWLFAVRLFKSRSLASQAVAGGRVHVNGERVKPSRAVRVGDGVAFARGAVEFDCTVLALPRRRGPAPEAARCYQESQASVARRAQFAERMRVGAVLAPRPAARPDKHERRELRRMRGRDD